MLLSVAVYASAVAAAFDCQVALDGIKYDLSPLAGDHWLTSVRDTPPSKTNTSWYINLCEPLKLAQDHLPENERCPDGTWVCGVQKVITDDKPAGILTEVIPVAGDFDGRPSTSVVRKARQGFTVQLQGGHWADHADIGTVIEFVCDETVEATDKIEFVDWDETLLQLTWTTAHACKDKRSNNDDQNKTDPHDPAASDPASDPASSSSFFSWFFGLLVVGIVAYLVIGAWFNYSRYGGSGVDLLPHSDAMRDIPFLVRDFARKVINTFAGSSRQGYTAV